MDQGFKDMFPELFTPESIERKMQIILEVLMRTKKLQKHALSCQINTFQNDCEICDNMSAFSNTVLMAERQRGEKFNIKEMIEYYEKVCNK